MSTENPTITPAHLLPFGCVVHVFAKIEFIMQAMIGAMAGTNLSSVLFMTGGLGFRARRDCLLNIAKLKRPDIVPELEKILERIQTANTLRNNVAHSIWKPGRRPGSIKPIGAITQGGKARVVGVSDNEREWTPEELWNDAHQIELLHTELDEFSERSGLAAIIDRMTDETNAPTSPENGTPPSK